MDLAPDKGLAPVLPPQWPAILSICTIAEPGLHAAQPSFMRPGHFLNQTVPSQ